MHQVRHSREPVASGRAPKSSAVPMVARTDLSSLINDYTSSQRRYQDRLESLEREMASLKGQVSQALNTSEDHELNQTYTTRKLPSSARTISPSRIPLPTGTPRKNSGENNSIASGKTLSSGKTNQVGSIARSKTFHSVLPTTSAVSSPPDENGVLRLHRNHLEQTLRKEALLGPDVKVPSYVSFDEVLKANEHLVVENERLRFELNRLKTESILLLRTLKTNASTENISGNERITAERERHELTMELARQIEENKRLRRSLLVQSQKFLNLRQSAQLPEPSKPAHNELQQTLETSSNASQSSTQTHQKKLVRHHSDSRAMVRPKSFYNPPKEFL